MVKKYLFLFTFILVFTFATFSQSGIEFSSEPWKELLEKAEKQNKLIFLDAYTVWCGPCRMMSRDVFPLEEVGRFYNSSFVNAKIDMEKGEGIELAKKYNIYAYPSLLFFDGKGEVVHRAVGYHAADMLIQLGEVALDGEKNILGLRKRYDKGDRSPAFLLEYAKAAQLAMEPIYEDLAEEYLSTQENWLDPEIMDFIFLMTEDLDSKMFRFILNNKKAFEDKYGDRAVTGKIEQLIQYKIMRAKTEQELRHIENTYRTLGHPNTENVILRIRMAFFLQNEKWLEYATASDNYFNSNKTNNWEELNESAWIIYETLEGEKEIKMALGWVKKSIKLNSNYYNNDTLAFLLHKSGKDKKALKAARKAIALAQKEGEDFSSTQQLVDTILQK